MLHSGDWRAIFRVLTPSAGDDVDFCVVVTLHKIRRLAITCSRGSLFKYNSVPDHHSQDQIIAKDWSLLGPGLRLPFR